MHLDACNLVYVQLGYVRSSSCLPYPAMMQSKPRMAPPPDLPYPLPAALAGTAEAAQPPTAGITGRNTSAVSIVPPRHATGATALSIQATASGAVNQLDNTASQQTCGQSCQTVKTLVTGTGGTQLVHHCTPGRQVLECDCVQTALCMLRSAHHAGQQRPRPHHGPAAGGRPHPHVCHHG